MNIAVVGCGKMGRMIEAVSARREDVQIAGFVGRGGCASLDELEEMDAALDFSHPDNLNGLLESTARRKIPLVIGTTGFSDAQGEAIREAGRSIPIVWADNFSVGVTVLGRLAAEAARMLGGGFDMEIVEMHHRCKADAPSGTAKMLLRRVDPGGAYAVLNGRRAKRRARAGNRRACGAWGHGCGRTQAVFFRADGRAGTAPPRGQPRNLCARRASGGGICNARPERPV